MTDYPKLFVSAWQKSDSAACCDVISMGLREAGDEFGNWLARDAVTAVMGYAICRAKDGFEPPYLDSFALPIAERLAQVFRDRDELPRLAWPWLLRAGSPKQWEETIADCARPRQISTER